MITQHVCDAPHGPEREITDPVTGQVIDPVWLCRCGRRWYWRRGDWRSR